jgi:hypothetical protein
MEIIEAVNCDLSDYWLTFRFCNNCLEIEYPTLIVIFKYKEIISFAQREMLNCLSFDLKR